DAYGNAAAGYTGTAHFTSTDPVAILPADYTFTAADNGVHTFSGVILRTAGSRSVTASDTASSSLTGSAPLPAGAAGPAHPRLARVAGHPPRRRPLLPWPGVRP